MSEPDRIIEIAEAELANVRRLIGDHLKVCAAPRTEPGSLTGACPQCKSLAVHLGRCSEQVRLLASGEDQTEALF